MAAAVFVAKEGLDGAFSLGEGTSVEELREEDSDVSPSDCVRLAKLGGAETETWWW